MTPQIPKSEPAGGDGLLFSIAASVITIVAFEAVFLAFPSWWLLVVVLLSAILATCGVVFALLRTIDGDTRLGPRMDAVKPSRTSQPLATSAPSMRGPVVAGR